MKRITLLLIFILSLVLAGCSEKSPVPQEQSKPQALTETPAPDKEKVKVTLYFASEQADALVPVVRDIDKPGDMVVALITELGKPGKNAPVLPQGTELVYYQKEGDTITLNFNEAFGNLQGSTGEFITVNSVVNTITELPEFKKVKLIVEGKPLSTGHAVYDQPLDRNESVIKK